MPGIPHHVTQRGNRRQHTFFSQNDYRLYVTFMAEYCRRCKVEIWAYCLMPNHVHLIAVPSSENALRLAIGEAHRRYTLRINSREDWKGHLWQGRFSSYPMDERHVVAAARYIELNPVRAGLVQSPEEWRWSSARAHLAGKDDILVRTKPLLTITGDWTRFLTGDVTDMDALRKHQNTGRPLGDDAFIRDCERMSGRSLKRQKPGPTGPRKAER